MFNAVYVRVPYRYMTFNASFQGAHMTIMARNEDDLDPDDVLKKVAKSSGSNYSFHKEVAKPAEPIGPVVCQLIFLVFFRAV